MKVEVVLMGRIFFVTICLGMILLAACSPAAGDETEEIPAGFRVETTPSDPVEDQPLLSIEDHPAIVGERDPDVPELPFPDNPDPALCGIPQPWNSDEPAYLTGSYEGELVQPIVFLYDSHLRREIQAQAPHGTEVQIILSQSNPALNYYMVKIIGADPPNEGWVPAPFVSFEPVPAEEVPVLTR